MDITQSSSPTPLHHAAGNSGSDGLGGYPPEPGTAAGPHPDGDCLGEERGGDHERCDQLCVAAAGSDSGSPRSSNMRCGSAMDGPRGWSRGSGRQAAHHRGGGPGRPPLALAGPSIRKIAVLAKKQAALKTAIRQGRENPVDRAIRILEGALGDVVSSSRPRRKRTGPQRRGRSASMKCRSRSRPWSGRPGPPSGTRLYPPRSRRCKLWWTRSWGPPRRLLRTRVPTIPWTR